MANVTFSGGKKLQEVFKKAGKGGIKHVDVGFFSSATYPDGTTVAAVAAWNEFGTKIIPERPFFRIANAENELNLIRIITTQVDPLTMVITKRIGNSLGVNHQGAVQKSMVDLRDPENAESTLIKKKGKTNPLIHTNKMNRSVTYKVT